MATLPSKTRFILHQHVEYRTTKAGGMLLDIVAGTCFELNQVGAEVWRCLAAGGTVEDAVVSLRSRYQVAPQVASDDVGRICEEWLTAGLVFRHPEGTS